MQDSGEHDRAIDPELGLAEDFGDIACLLLAADGPKGTVHKICSLAANYLAACESAGVSFIEDNRIVSWAQTDDKIERLDRLQSETGEGPSLDVDREGGLIVSVDLSCEDRWPTFAQRAVEQTNVRSVLSVRFCIAAETGGALSLYSSGPNAFRERDRALVKVFAAYAAVAMRAARVQEQLETALRSRDVIGQAKGILMATRGCSEDEAFEALRRASNGARRKLRDVAQVVTLTGQLPEQVGTRPQVHPTGGRGELFRRRRGGPR